MDGVNGMDELSVDAGNGETFHPNADCRNWKRTGRFCPPAWCCFCDNVRAFNEGCDARLTGQGRSSNPYDRSTSEGKRWLIGWEHVDRYWGCDARRHGGLVRPLPAVA